MCVHHQRVKEFGIVLTVLFQDRARRGRPRLSDLKHEMGGFRVRLGSDSLMDDAGQSLDNVEEPQRRKRARTSSIISGAQQTLQGPMTARNSLTESGDRGTAESSRERKRSKLTHQKPTELANVLPGIFVLHLTAPGSIRGSYDTIRSCHITSMSTELRSSRSDINDIEQMSEVDSDSEETAKAFLSAMRHQRLVSF